jgi:hypothetical protein
MSWAICSKVEIYEDTHCSICKEEYKYNEPNNCFVLPCDHLFHEKCVKEWADKNRSCPLCRRAFRILPFSKRLRNFLTGTRPAVKAFIGFAGFASLLKGIDLNLYKEVKECLFIVGVVIVASLILDSMIQASCCSRSLVRQIKYIPT